MEGVVIKLEPGVPKKEEIMTSTQLPSPGLPTTPALTQTPAFVRPWEVSPVKGVASPPEVIVITPTRALQFGDSLLSPPVASLPTTHRDDLSPPASGFNLDNKSPSPIPDVRKECEILHSRLVNTLAECMVMYPDSTQWLRVLHASYEQTVTNMRSIQLQAERDALRTGGLEEVRRHYDLEAVKVTEQTLRTLEEFRSSRRSWRKMTTTPPGYFRGRTERKHSTPNSSISGSEDSLRSSSVSPVSTSSSDPDVSTSPPVFSSSSSSSSCPSSANTSENSSESSSGNSSGNNSGNSVSPPVTSSVPPQGRGRQQRGQLDQTVVELMKRWYSQNFDHPYPSDETVEYFSRVGGITKTQVKKWMANRRVRSCNTLTFNNSVHPRRLRRLQKEMSYLSNSQRHTSSNLSNGRYSPYVINRSPPYMQRVTPVTSAHVLDAWYEANRNYPYPSEMEKETLGLMSSMTREEVRGWLAERRRRDREELVASTAAQSRAFVSQLTSKLKHL